MAYCGYITTIKELRPHSNADRLQIATLFGNDVVVGLDVQIGDLGIYFPTDGKLGLEFAKKNNLLRKDENGNEMGGYLEYNKRHIKAIKLRGEVSDGLFLPITSLKLFTDIDKLKEGDTITKLDDVTICEKYIPKSNKPIRNMEHQKKKKKIKDLYPYFAEHVDTSQFAYNVGEFKEGDICYITLKAHGTSARTSNTIKKEREGLFKKSVRFLFGEDGISKLPKKWENISGTRRVVLENYEGGYYSSNEFRKQWHDFFEGKLQKGESIYYEIVGYIDEDKTIMPVCDNKKINDKEFIKRYGKTTSFTYGCGKGESDIYVYRMTKTDEDGHVVEYPTELVKLRCEQMGAKHVPILDKFIFTTQEDLWERVRRYESGADLIDNSHIREGVVIRIDNREKFKAFKQKSTDFKILEGIIKSEDVLDLEEEESYNE